MDGVLGFLVVIVFGIFLFYGISWLLQKYTGTFSLTYRLKLLSVVRPVVFITTYGETPLRAESGSYGTPIGGISLGYDKHIQKIITIL
jgi:hypothetical protein